MKYIFVILAFFSLITKSYSQIILDRFSEDKYKPIIFLGLGSPFGHNADKFINLYQKGFGGNKQEFSTTPQISVEYKSWILPKMRLGLSTAYHNISYFDEFWTSGAYITRNHTNEIEFHRLPFLLKVEFIPYNKQFRSYVGLGIGALLQKIRWKETVRSTFNLDKRKNAVLFDETTPIPGINLYSGLELGFDEYPESFFLGSLIFQVDYSYFPNKIDIFKKARSVLDEPNNLLNQKVPVFANYFNFTVGISFNLLNVLKNH